MLHIKTVPSRLVNALSLCLAGLFVKCWSLVLLILGHLLHVALQCLILLRVVWIRQSVVGVRLSRSPWSPVLLPLLVLLLKKQVSRRAKLIRVSIEVIIFLRIIITDGRVLFLVILLSFNELTRARGYHLNLLLLLEYHLMRIICCNACRSVLLHGFTLCGDGRPSPERRLNHLLRLISIPRASQGIITALQRVVSLILIMLHYLRCFAHSRDSSLGFRRMALMLLALPLFCLDAHRAWHFHPIEQSLIGCRASLIEPERSLVLLLDLEDRGGVLRLRGDSGHDRCDFLGGLSCDRNDRVLVW